MVFLLTFAAINCGLFTVVGFAGNLTMALRRRRERPVAEDVVRRAFFTRFLTGRGGKLFSLLGKRLKVPLASADIRRLLLASGQPLQLDPHGYVVVRCMAALGGGVLALLVSPMIGRLSFIAFFALPLLALVLPDLYLRRKISQRIVVMSAEAADFFAVLKVTIAAGKTPLAALAQAGDVCHGELAFECSRLARQVQLGVPRSVAYTDFLERCPLPLARPFIAGLLRSDQYGTSLTPTLTSLCAEARATQLRIMREHAAKAAPKVQLVVALLLVPAVMLIVAAALMQALVPVK